MKTKILVVVKILSAIAIGAGLTIALPVKAGNPEQVAQLRNTKQCPGCDLSGVELIGVDLNEANLEGADLSGAILRNVSLIAANLSRANLTNADLRGAILNGANLSGASLGFANLENASLYQVTARETADFAGATFKETTMPDGRIYTSEAIATPTK